MCPNLKRSAFRWNSATAGAESLGYYWIRGWTAEHVLATVRIVSDDRFARQCHARLLYQIIVAQ